MSDQSTDVTERKDRYIGLVECAECGSTETQLVGDWGGEADVLCAKCGTVLGVVDHYYLNDENITHPEERSL